MLGKLVRGAAADSRDTRPDASDARLRGRTYAIPFDRVWNSALLVAEEDMKRWEVVSWDDRAGMILIEAQSPVLRRLDDVRVLVSLDPDGQTRIDLTTRPKKEHGSVGTSSRVVGRFFRLLDGRLGLHTHPTTAGGRGGGDRVPTA